MSITVNDKTLEIWKSKTCQVLCSMVYFFWTSATSFLTFPIFVKFYSSIAFLFYNISINKSFFWKVIPYRMIIFANNLKVGLALLAIRINLGVGQCVYLSLELRISISFTITLTLKVLFLSSLYHLRTFYQ